MTLGSPHQAPVVPDSSLRNFTRQVRKNFVEKNCVSVSGGLSDIQVRPALSITPQCLNVRGEAVPMTWTSQETVRNGYHVENMKLRDKTGKSLEFLIYKCPLRDGFFASRSQC